jgi:hypothetical protein
MDGLEDLGPAYAVFVNGFEESSELRGHLAVEEDEEGCELHLACESHHFFVNVVGDELIGSAIENEKHKETE